MKVEIYDVDNAKDLNNLSNHDFVGTAEFVLGKIVTSMNQESTENLVNGPSQAAKVKIMAEELRSNVGQTQVTFAMKFIHRDTFEYFITINKHKSPGQYAPVYKSEVKPCEKGVYNYGMLTSDTDTMSNNDDQNEIMF